MTLLRTLVLGAGLLLTQPIALAEQGVVPGKQAPAFELTTLKGKQLSVSNNKKPLYLKFWATWCSYCMEEMPHLQQTFEHYGNDIDVVAVNVGMNESLRRVKHFLKQNQYTMPVNFDQFSELVTKFKVVGTPQHILIDAQGQIVHRSALITDDLDDKINNAIAQSKQEQK